MSDFLFYLVLFFLSAVHSYGNVLVVYNPISAHYIHIGRPIGFLYLTLRISRNVHHEELLD